MSLTIIAWHDRDQAGHNQQTIAAAAQGYRTLSLCVYGSRTNPRYAAVMIKRPVVQAELQFAGLTLAQLQAKHKELSLKGMGPYLVSATGPVADPLFAVSFQPVAATPVLRCGLTAAELDDLNDAQMHSDCILQALDAYGTPGDLRYVAIWRPNPERVNWNCNAVPDDAATAQQRFTAITSVGGRPYLLALAPGGGVLQAYADTSVGKWASRGGLTSQRYQQEFDQQLAAGRVPVCVAAEGEGEATRFAAIFGEREDAAPRTFRATGPTTVPAIDQAMEKFMRAQNIRNVSLAITFSTRLLYAKGYTWAEADYPTVQPTTLFRQASVSKTLAALAMYQIMEQNPQVTLDTTVQSVLKLKTPAGAPPPAPRFAKITIRHLLESTSALNIYVMSMDVPAAQAFGGLQHLPVTPKQLASYVASLNLDGTNVPGDTHNARYSNTGYFLLSQVVATLRGANSFEEAITPTLLKPLGITRLRQSVSLIGDQAPDEARYQLRYLNDKDAQGKQLAKQRAFDTWASVRTPDQPLVPVQYGSWSAENLDGAGGLSAAAPDMARLVAMLSSGTANPVLKAATLNQLLASAATCTATYLGPDKHGYHGFDGVTVEDATRHTYKGYKGGWLGSSQNGFSFTTGGYGFVVCMGSNNAEGVTQEWEDDVHHATAQYPWGSSLDLFPQFGMAPLVPPAVPAPPKPILPVMPVPPRPSFPAVPALSITASIRLQQTRPAAPTEVPQEA